MTNLKLAIRLLIVFVTVIVVFGSYKAGKSAGVNAMKAINLESQNIAMEQFNLDLQKVASDHNRMMNDLARKYEVELEAQALQVVEINNQYSTASNETSKIKERIKYVESDCSNIGDDAYSVYKRTRSVISDPRNTDF